MVPPVATLDQPVLDDDSLCQSKLPKSMLDHLYEIAKKSPLSDHETPHLPLYRPCVSRSMLTQGRSMLHRHHKHACCPLSGGSRGEASLPADPVRSPAHPLPSPHLSVSCHLGTTRLPGALSGRSGRVRTSPVLPDTAVSAAREPGGLTVDRSMSRPGVIKGWRLISNM